MKCLVCNGEVDSLRGAAYEIRGFDQDRDAGGTNHVLWRERTGRVMCATCVIRRKSRIDPNQTTLGAPA